MVGPTDKHDRETLLDMAEEELAELNALVNADKLAKLRQLAETAAAAAHAAVLQLKLTPYSSKAATILHVSLGQISLVDKLDVGPDWSFCPEVAEAYREVFMVYPSTYQEEQRNG